MAFNFVSCAQSDKPIVIKTEEFRKKMSDPEVQIIDVRTDEEVEEGVLPGAIQMDVSDWEAFVEKAKNLDSEKPVLLYCRSGARSNRAGKYLLQNGFKEVYDLQGGIIDWKKNNGEIIKK